jgi:hypothetical protein
MILDGSAVGVSRRFLENLPSKSMDEVAVIAASIEDGTFENPRPDASVSVESVSNAGGLSPDKQELDDAISKISDIFFTELRGLLINNDTAGSKVALRSYIDMLEKLYSQM